MMPVAPTPRKSSTFTIDSLVGKDSNKGTRESSVSPPARPGDRREPVSLGGMRSGFHPVSPGGGFPPHSLGLKVLGHEASLAHLDSLHHLQQAGVNFGSGHPGLHPLQCGLPPPIAHSSPLPPGLHPSHPGMPPHTQIHPMFMNAAQREGLPFYPWLLSRPGGLLNHRFMGPEASLLLQPFRKPKRIRTAFSPSQLLRLEHAFEKNHYVVGQERKELAVNLSLTETQVKVWFQNRRTKYKRMRAEESEGKTGLGEHTDGSEARLEDSRDDLDSEIDDEELEGEAEERAAMAAAEDDLDYDESETINVTDDTDMPPDPKRSKLTHHLNRWRVDTNQN